MDRQFVSFPKSGRTWLRYALAHLGLADSIRFHHDGFEYNDGAKPPLDFDYQRRLETYTCDKKIVYLHRDPRDVMVSLFHQVTGRFRDFFHYPGSLSDFIRDPYFGAENLHRFRQQWKALCVEGRALAISYEDCHARFPDVLTNVVRHYGFVAGEQQVRAAANAARFDRMKAVETTGSFDQPWLRLRNGSPKVRRGRVGGFADELAADDIAYLDGIFARDT